MDKQLATEYAAKVKTSAMNLQSDARKPLMFVITDSILSIMSIMIVLMVTIHLMLMVYTHAYDCCRDAAWCVLLSHSLCSSGSLHIWLPIGINFRHCPQVIVFPLHQAARSPIAHSCQCAHGICKYQQLSPCRLPVLTLQLLIQAASCHMSHCLCTCCSLHMRFV